VFDLIGDVELTTPRIYPYSLPGLHMIIEYSFFASNPKLLDIASDLLRYGRTIALSTLEREPDRDLLP
jgi:hypothetical protein